MPERSARYAFHPLERRGVLLGLQPTQLGVVAGGLLFAWVLSRAVPAPFGGALGVCAAVAASASALWSRDGRTASGWLSDWLAWAVRRSRGPTVDAHPVEGTAAGADATGILKSRTRSPATRAGDAPGMADGIRLIELPAEPGESTLGVVVDLRRGTWAAVVPVKGRSFSLLDPGDQERRLDGWRVVLNSIGRPGTAVRRLQWVQRCAPGDGADLAEVAGSLGDDPPARSYRDLVAAAGPATQSNEVWLVVAVDGPSRPGRPAATRAAEALRRELRLLRGRLRSADLLAGGSPGLDGLADLLRSGLDGSVGDVRNRGAGNRLRRAWSMADDEAWAALRCDSWWHATYWIAEWPRVEVGPDFMTPLLLSGGRRTVSLVLAPVPADKAAREARSARTADAADEQLRTSAGFLPSARRDREAVGAQRREEELADGHTEYRFSGYVAVTAASRDELAVRCAETEHAAQASHLEIRRLYGRQREAFTWTLPLARGLR